MPGGIELWEPAGYCESCGGPRGSYRAHYHPVRNLQGVLNRRRSVTSPGKKQAEEKLAHVQSAIHVNALAGDVCGFLRGKENDCSCHFLYLSGAAQRNLLTDFLLAGFGMDLLLGHFC